MKRQLLVGLGVAILLGACLYVTAKLVRRHQATQPRANADGVLQVANQKRVYDLHIPASYTGQTPMPLVIAFHGVGGDGKAMAEQTSFNQLSEQAGFIVTYPDAISQHWDARRGSQPETTDDVGFISALIDTLAQNYSLDRRRVYVVGFSNGGMFVHRLACELSDKIAAIAAVSATMPENLARTCQPVKPISVLLMHGTEDSAIPYNSAGKALLSLSDTVKFWSTHNRCSLEAVKESLPNAPDVRLDAYRQCQDEASVMLYTIEGGGHAWAGSDSKPMEPSGKPGQAFHASTIIWDFFSKHPAP